MNNHHYLKLLLSTLFNSSFSQDSAFQTKGFFINNNADLITTAAAQPDGKIIVTGDFSFVGGHATTNVVPLLGNGVRDTASK